MLGLATLVVLKEISAKIKVWALKAFNRFKNKFEPVQQKNQLTFYGEKNFDKKCRKNTKIQKKYKFFILFLQRNEFWKKLSLKALKLFTHPKSFKICRSL